jgi:hypothetical protein
MKLGKYKIYEDSFNSTITIVLNKEDKKRFTLTPGEGFRVGERLYFFMGIRPGSTMIDKGHLQDAVLIFEELDNKGMPLASHTVRISDKIYRFHVDDILVIDQTILRVVQDSGFSPALAGFIIMGLGLALTFIQKLGEKDI